MKKKTLIITVLLVVLVGVVVRAFIFDEWIEAGSRAYFVPYIVTPSVQPVSGQVVLFKMTNVSSSVVNLRLSLYKDEESLPGTYKDFMGVRGGQTVSYVYEPAIAELTLGSATIEAPEAVRAEIVPMPGDDIGAIRNVIANVQLMRIQPAVGNGTRTMEAPIVVPVQHCIFEPRGFVPIHTGSKYLWNCVPQMFPYDQKWLKPGMNSGGPPRVKN